MKEKVAKKKRKENMKRKRQRHTRMRSRWGTIAIPTLKFLTHPAPQVPHLGHDPSNRLIIMFNMFSIFYLEEGRHSLE